MVMTLDEDVVRAWREAAEAAQRCADTPGKETFIAWETAVFDAQDVTPGYEPKGRWIDELEDADECNRIADSLAAWGGL